MDAIDSIAILIEDVVINILTHFSWDEILNFGSTNGQFHAMVSRYISSQEQRIGVSPFALNWRDASSPTVLELFGMHFHHLAIVIDGRFLDMNIFHGTDGLLLTQIQQLTLFVRRPNIDQVMRDISATSEDIIYCLNSFQMPTLQHLRLLVFIEVDATNYNEHVHDYGMQRNFDEMGPTLFGLLARGNMHTNVRIILSPRWNLLSLPWN